MKLIFSIVARIRSVVSPTGSLRLPDKSAGDVLAAAFATAPPLSQRLKRLYLDGSIPNKINDEAGDEEKRASVWRLSLRYSELKDGDTSLVDWQ